MWLDQVSLSSMKTPRYLTPGCSRHGFVADFYIKISKLVIFTTYNHV